MDAILASTSSAARLIGLEEKIGSLQRGKAADLIVIEGNPLRKIELLRDRNRIAGVMKDGRFVAGPLVKA